MQEQGLVKRFMKSDIKLTNIMVYTVFYLVALMLGLSYITQREMTFELRSTTEGYLLVVVVIALVGYKIIFWLKTRGK